MGPRPHLGPPCPPSKGSVFIFVLVSYTYVYIYLYTCISRYRYIFKQMSIMFYNYLYLCIPPSLWPPLYLKLRRSIFPVVFPSVLSVRIFRLYFTSVCFIYLTCVIPTDRFVPRCCVYEEGSYNYCAGSFASIIHLPFFKLGLRCREVIVGETVKQIGETKDTPTQNGYTNQNVTAAASA